MSYTKLFVLLVIAGLMSACGSSSGGSSGGASDPGQNPMPDNPFLASTLIQMSPASREDIAFKIAAASADKNAEARIETIKYLDSKLEINCTDTCAIQKKQENL